MLMTIQVTDEHIRNGNKNTCFNCPVAKAIHDVVIRYTIVAVRRTNYSIGYETQYSVHHTTPLPEVVTEFIDAFDLGIQMSAFEFQVDVPSEFVLPTQTEDKSCVL